MAETDVIKENLIAALETTEVEAEGYKELVEMYEKVKRIELESAKLESQKEIEEMRVKSQDKKSLFDLIGKGLLIGGSGLFCLIAERAKEEGVVMKVIEWFNQGGNLLRKV